MKRILTCLIVSLTLLIAGCGGETINISELIVRGGVYYKVNSEWEFSGKAIANHPNGQKGFEWNFKDGKRDGLSTEWYFNGQKESEKTYKNGRLNGLSTCYWYEIGQKKSEHVYKDGKIVAGKSRQWDESGKAVVDHSSTATTDLAVKASSPQFAKHMGTYEFNNGFLIMTLKGDGTFVYGTKTSPSIHTGGWIVDGDRIQLTFSKKVLVGQISRYSFDGDGQLTLMEWSSEEGFAEIPEGLRDVFNKIK